MYNLQYTLVRSYDKAALPRSNVIGHYLRLSPCGVNRDASGRQVDALVRCVGSAAREQPEAKNGNEEDCRETNECPVSQRAARLVAVDAVNRPGQSARE